MHSRPPQSLIGVDIAHTGDHALIEQCALDCRPLSPERGHQGLAIQSGIQQISGDMRYRGRNEVGGIAIPAGSAVRRSNERAYQEIAKCALIDEIDASAVLQSQSGSKMAMRHSSDRLGSRTSIWPLIPR